MIDLGVLGAGSYEMNCEITGHAAAGMTGALTIGGTSASASGTDHAANEAAATADYLHGYASWEEMEAAMNERAMAFLDPSIKGEVGGQKLAPEILPDGTKRFELTAAITDWEVEPGVTVKAWTYNGVVPAPEIRVEVGDKVQVVRTNNLPTATSIHFHGIRVPNAMDGVPPYTQDSIAPGAEYTYEFEAIEPAVGIYHSHSGAEQVLAGLFGAFMIGEMTIPDVLVEQGIDHVDQEVNMVLNDAGVIGLSLNGKSFPATQAYTAKVGDVMMVHYFNEGCSPTRCTSTSRSDGSSPRTARNCSCRCPVTRSTSHPASATRCCTRSRTQVCGPGTVTSSPTPSGRTACSAW